MIFSLGSGALFGLFFFGGLRWTVTMGLRAQKPAGWFLGSLWLRAGLLMVGFSGVCQGDWTRWLACLLGFWLVRGLVMYAS